MTNKSTLCFLGGFPKSTALWILELWKVLRPISELFAKDGSFLGVKDVLDIVEYCTDFRKLG